uniref:AAA+ ATPase domain-containing protein n=1 Tax=Tetradesmus obliquus TaxID=3088 RepID=A0A383V5B1_TETOB|eukprot:jgi/Sobl393_1/355/SZX60143.1
MRVTTLLGSSTRMQTPCQRHARQGRSVSRPCGPQPLPKTLNKQRHSQSCCVSYVAVESLLAGPQPQEEPEQLQPQQMVVQDDLDQLLGVLPAGLGESLISHPQRSALIEVVLDLGRRPEARFQGSTAELLREEPVTREELDAAAAAVAPFGSDNRAGIAGTLHRISALRSRKGAVVGLTCRVGRAVSGHVDMINDILEANLPILFLGRPGVGKTTAIREIARTLSDELRKRVVIVDTSNEIGGDGDVPHHAIGGARRMQVADASKQHHVMIEAVENHMPQVVIVDEIGTEAEATACRTIAERGVVLIGTAHGCFLENLIKNPTLTDLVGGVSSVTLGDEEARSRGTQKSVLERKGPPAFPIVIEMRDRGAWVAHDTAESVDALLVNKVPKVQLRLRDPVDGEVTMLECAYDQVEAQILAQMAQHSGDSSRSSSNTASQEEDTLAAAAAQLRSHSNSSSIDDLVASVLRTGSSSSSGSNYSLQDALAGAELDPMDWLERFKGLNEAEALQELAAIKYLGGQAGLLRPRASGGFGYGARPGSAVAASGSSKKSKKRAASRANAKY